MTGAEVRPGRRLITNLADVVGADHVITDADVRVGYERDWTGRYRGTAHAVVRPASTDEVASVVRVCAAAGAAVITQGGNTGLVGGSIPPASGARPTVVLSTRRLDRCGPVDDGAAQMTAGAGVTIADWQAHARAAGLDVPIDFAARDSATIGGAIATNAGGSRVLRFGTMRQQVLGLEAVLASGEVVGSLAGLPKETVGIHLPSVLAGSEGTLGVVTAARLRLVPWYRSTVTALVGVGSIADAVTLLGRLRSGVATLDAVELILPEALALVSSHLGVEPPVAESAVYLVVECADHDDPSDELAGALGTAPEVTDAAVAAGGPARERLVAFRDRITEAINVAGTPFKLDVAVPVARLGDLLDLAQRAVDRHGGRLVPFGHLAEGNVHLNVLDAAEPEAIAAEVLPAVADLGGTISAEHGVGRAKVRWMPLVRTSAEIDVLRSIKTALDPEGIFNPGVLIDDQHA